MKSKLFMQTIQIKSTEIKTNHNENQNYSYTYHVAALLYELYMHTCKCKWNAMEMKPKFLEYFDIKAQTKFKNKKNNVTIGFCCYCLLQ